MILSCSTYTIWNKGRRHSVCLAALRDFSATSEQLWISVLNTFRILIMKNWYSFPEPDARTISKLFLGPYPLLCIPIRHRLYMRSHRSRGRQHVKRTSLESLAPSHPERKMTLYLHRCHLFRVVARDLICRFTENLFSLCCPSDLLGVVLIYHRLVTWESSIEG